MFCRICGQDIKAGQDVCDNCGTRVERAGPAAGPKAPAGKKNFCVGCGAELAEAEEFCGKCGHPAKAEAAPVAPAAPPPQPAAAAPAPVAPAAAAAPGAPAEKAPSKLKKIKIRKVPILIGAGVLVVVAVVLILVFTLMGGGGPQSAVQQFLSAAQSKNESQALAVVDPESLKKIPGGEKTFKDKVLGAFSGGVNTGGLKYEVQTSGDKATVTVTQGITKGELPKKYELVKSGGKWVVVATTFEPILAKAYFKEAEDIMTGGLDEDLGNGVGVVNGYSEEFSKRADAKQKFSSQEVEAYESELKSTADAAKEPAEKAQKILEAMGKLSGEGLGDYKEYGTNGGTALESIMKVFESALAKYAIFIEALKRVESSGGEFSDDEISKYEAFFNEESDAYSAAAKALESMGPVAKTLDSKSTFFTQKSDSE